MNDDAAQEILMVLNKMTEELNSLNDNILYIAERYNKKHRDINIEQLLKEISNHLMTKINDELYGCHLCASHASQSRQFNKNHVTSKGS